MIDLITSFFKEGDYIKIYYNNSNQSAEGLIIKILPSSIAIKTKENKTIGIKGDLIESFEEINTASINNIDIKTNVAENKVIESEEKDEKKINDNKEEITNDDQSSKEDSKLREYKAGEVMPLEVLKERSTTKPKIKKDGKKLSSIGTGLESLSILVNDKHEQDNKKFVPPLGTIKLYFPDKDFGFIKDGKSGKDIYFHSSEIIDPSLVLSMYSHDPVIYNVIEGAMGTRAITIHKPMTIKELLELAKTLVSKRDYKKAIYITEHILSEYPDNYSADELNKQIKRQFPQYNFNYSNQKEYSSIYNKAKKHHLRKEYQQAILLYRKTVESKSEKTVSAIKDLGMIYAELYKNEIDETQKEKYRKEAIDLIDKYEAELPDNISTLYYLENLFYSIGDYEDYLDIADELLEENDVISFKSKQCNILYKKAMSLIQLNKTAKAKEIIEEGLSIDPQNQALIKLQSVMQNNSSAEEIKAAISSTEFESLNYGLSLFIQQTLENYDEYVGVKTKDIESRNFTKTTLRDVRQVIDKAGAARARERANYLLTEGKLMMELEPSEELRLRTVMARYCNAMALSHISNNSPMDVIRFFYNEAFILEESWDSNARQIALYLLTHIHTYTELINDSGKNNSIDNTLELVLQNGFDTKLWDSILTMMLNNTSISAQITEKLFKRNTWKSQSIQALEYFGVKVRSNILSLSEFVSSWNLARELRLRDYQKISTAIKSYENCSNIEELVLNLYDINKIIEEWICPLDRRRLYEIVNNVAPAIDVYIKSSGYRNKEANNNNANGQIQHLIDDIIERPTKLSYDAILPLMEKVQKILSLSFDEVVKMSEPKIKIKLLSSETVVNENLVQLQIYIENHKDSSPIREVNVAISPTEDIKYVDESNTLYNAIEGGDGRIFKVKIHVSDKVIKNKATVLDAVCKYKNGNETNEYKSQLSLKLYDPTEFVEINNPYSPIADGGPVPITSNMFYGREEFISNISNSILNSPSKQIIIYGQKRCGKSSVMLHLKEKLLATNKTFCIFFSMGEIINNLSEASFFYKILDTINTELEILEFEGKEIPNFKIPKYAEFKAMDEDNPLNTFTKYMILFKMACKQSKEWEDKNLVVMIDEFTYLYTEIKKGHISESIMKQWKAITQNERAQFSVVLVGQDVVPSFKKEEYASNAFGVIQDIRLTYLEEQPAKDLIQNPILDECGESRYVGNAVNRILEYTSRNPYYIQIFCARLVDFMNKNKSLKVTEADVNEVANSFVVGDQALEIDKFDNLIRAGESEDLQEIPEKEIVEVLRQIATCTKNITYCNRSDIITNIDEDEVDNVLQHLIDREVLEKKGDNYKIQVKLFQEWLLNH